MPARPRSVHPVALLAAGALAALAGAGGASAQSERTITLTGGDAAAGAVVAPSCVLGVGADDVPAGAPEWALGLLARSDELNRNHGLGRHAPDGECADVPDWYRALLLRSAIRNTEGAS